MSGTEIDEGARFFEMTLKMPAFGQICLDAFPNHSEERVKAHGYRASPDGGMKDRGRARPPLREESSRLSRDP